MNQILFRAWDIKKNNWVSIKILELLGIFNLHDSHLKDSERGTPELIFEQFTGALDINGNKIFKGDICNVQEYPHQDPAQRWHRGFIVWSDAYHRWFIRCMYSNNPNSDYYSFSLGSLYKIEVVGNIHEQKL